MTKDEILALSGDDLDALVAEKVMGIDKEELFHAPLLNHWCGYVRRRDLEGDTALAQCYRSEPLGKWEYCGTEYSRDRRALLTILDRMISLGWEPLLQHDDDGWLVAFGKGNGDGLPLVSMNLLEAVCKCALLAVMGV
jgi:hypothetical protein